MAEAVRAGLVAWTWRAAQAVRLARAAHSKRRASWRCHGHRKQLAIAHHTQGRPECLAAAQHRAHQFAMVHHWLAIDAADHVARAQFREETHLVIQDENTRLRAEMTSEFRIRCVRSTQPEQMIPPQYCRHWLPRVVQPSTCLQWPRVRSDAIARHPTRRKRPPAMPQRQTRSSARERVTSRWCRAPARLATAMRSGLTSSAPERSAATRPCSRDAFEFGDRYKRDDLTRLHVATRVLNVASACADAGERLGRGVDCRSAAHNAWDAPGARKVAAPRKRWTVPSKHHLGAPG